MAPFNPQVPATQDPNFLGYSKVIDAPAPDTTMQKVFSTIGAGLSGLVDIADTATKSAINDEVRKSVETNRDAQTAALERIRSEQKNGQIIPGKPGIMAMGDDEAESAPQSLEADLDRVGTIGAARAQGSNRINDTYYTMQLNSEAKRLRNQYPGYKDYIDQRFAQMTGSDPANAYYRNIMEDINRNMQSRNTPQAQALKIGYSAISAGVPDILPFIRQVEAGVPGAEDQLLSKVNAWNADRAIAEKEQRDRQRRNDTKSDTADSARTSFNKEFLGSVVNISTTPFQVTGLTEPTTLNRLMSQAAGGKSPLTDEQWQGVLTHLVQRRNALVSYGNQMYNSRDYATSWANPQQKDKDIESNLQMLDSMIQAVKDKDTGTAFETLRRIQSMQSDFDYQALTGPMGNWLKLNGLLKSKGGDIFQSETNRMLMNADVQQKLKTTLGNMVTRSMVSDSDAADGKQKSLLSDVDTLQKAGIGAETKIYDRLFDNVKRIYDPKTPENIKGEIIDYAFDQKNWHLMDKFKSDFVDSSGRTVPGKQSIFVGLTNPKMTDAVWQNSRGTPDRWVSYKNWAEQSFAKLFREDVQNLNEIQETRLKIGWDADKRQFILRGPNNQPLTGLSPTPSISMAQRTINRLNFGLSNLAHVQDQEGTDTSAYLVNVMNVLGWQPGKNVTGLPAQMVEAIANSHKSNQQRFQETFGR